METWFIPEPSRNAAVPADLAEWVGAVRLTHLALEAVQTVDAPLAEFRAGPLHESHGFRMLLTLLTYAYARGVFGSEDIQERTQTDFDFRYLATAEVPDALTLRRFRRLEWRRLEKALAHVLGGATGSHAGDAWFDPKAEAERRLETAVAADSLALDY